MPKHSDSDIIKNIYETLLSAKRSVEAAEDWFKLLADQNEFDFSGLKNSAKKVMPAVEKDDEEDEEGRIIHGLFDGQNMADENGEKYPIPVNYSSKSKLVQGDHLKLTIKHSGAFVFKQIELIPRRLETGKLILDGNQYKVLTSDNSYNVLYASVTFYKANVGDNVTIILPEGMQATWAAIENVIPE